MNVIVRTLIGDEATVLVEPHEKVITLRYRAQGALGSKISTLLLDAEALQDLQHVEESGVREQACLHAVLGDPSPCQDEQNYLMTYQERRRRELRAHEARMARHGEDPVALVERMERLMWADHEDLTEELELDMRAARRHPLRIISCLQMFPHLWTRPSIWQTLLARDKHEDLKELCPCYELRHEAEFVAELKAEGCSIGQLQKLCDLAQLRAAGFALRDFRGCGCTLEQLKTAGFSLSDLKNEGCSVRQLKTLIHHGLCAAEIASLRQAVHQVTDAVSARVLLELGYGLAELKNAGYSPNCLQDACCMPEQLQKAYSPAQFMYAGIHVAQMRAWGYSAEALKQAGFFPFEVLQAGFTVAELRAAGYTLTQLLNSGHSAGQLKDAGYGALELEAAGCTYEDLLDAGFPENQMRRVARRVVA
eukprot:TRINITY_DN75234_c0_g1_i1.p1 TRINITY_DN75234_c0_g1~~TRINITY_DN75234_c0_g1_i1.p1  ORF type:complete len:448 (-),score=63.51 TRINITY_DN75234_c0_g1_i1:353-1615(-)